MSGAGCGVRGARYEVRGTARRAHGTIWWLAAGVASLCLGSCSTPRTAGYVPRVRELTVTAVPLLTREMQRIYPFLRQDFAPGGVLDGKEIYAFVPSTLTVIEGDTIRFTLLNPEDDAHSFVLPGLTLALPGQSVVHATYVAERAGVFRFECDMPAHLPAMYGQLVVMPRP